MKITFWGASGGEVTGSMHRLDNNKASVLLDCGSRLDKNQIPLPDRLKRNTNVNAVVLSHPHTDHVGDLPNFVEQGFKGGIFSVHPTKDITAALLFQNEPRHRAESVMEKYKPTVDHNQRVEVAEGIYVTFIPAAHILGSSFTLIENNGLRILFSGDVGNKNKKLFDFPETLPEADVLLLESTYGARELHPDFNNSLNDMYHSIDRTISRSGNFPISGFSIQRTQELLYHLNKGKYEGQLPDDLRIVLDAPLGEVVTDIYLHYREYFSDEISSAFNMMGNPFAYTTHYDGKPCVILASSSISGSEGKIVQHYINGLENPNNTFAFPSYRPPGSLADRLARGCDTVHLRGKSLEVKAEIYDPRGFSSHADATQLFEIVKMVKPKIVFLVHGENIPRIALKEKIRGSVGEVILPGIAEEFDLETVLSKRAA